MSFFCTTFLKKIKKNISVNDTIFDKKMQYLTSFTVIKIFVFKWQKVCYNDKKNKSSYKCRYMRTNFLKWGGFYCECGRLQKKYYKTTE